MGSLNKDRVITPYDVEQSILRPQFDPLVGELVSRLLQKNKWKPRNFDEEELYFTMPYDQWNENLAKKFSSMFKNYKKF